MAVLKRSIVTVVGVLVVLVGVALMVLPGPGVLLVVVGLAILATEYAWARDLLGTAKEKALKAQEEAVASPWRTGATVLFGLVTAATGVAMLVVEDVAWPAWDTTLDAFWKPVTGAIVIVTSVILLTTTALAVRDARSDGPGWLG
ncbi:MAG: PGPGW domain-containing protein [Actinomycetes bacterium]